MEQFNLQGTQVERSFWPEWAKVLQRWGIDGVAAVLLESTGPFSILLAQLVYLGQPFFQQNVMGGQVQAVTHLLDDPKEKQAFVSFLREEETW
jgi:hypothetical protein